MTHTFSPWARCWHTWWLYKNNHFDNWYLTNLYLFFFSNTFPLGHGFLEYVSTGQGDRKSVV